MAPSEQGRPADWLDQRVSWSDTSGTIPPKSPAGVPPHGYSVVGMRRQLAGRVLAAREIPIDGGTAIVLRVLTDEGKIMVGVYASGCERLGPADAPTTR